MTHLMKTGKVKMKNENQLRTLIRQMIEQELNENKTVVKFKCQTTIDCEDIKAAVEKKGATATISSLVVTITIHRNNLNQIMGIVDRLPFTSKKINENSNIQGDVVFAKTVNVDGDECKIKITDLGYVYKDGKKVDMKDIKKYLDSSDKKEIKAALKRK